MTITFEPE
jgi:hypothetical protein